MTTKVFSISEALHFGWNTTKSNFGILIGFSIAMLVIFRMNSIIPTIAPENIFLEPISSIIAAVLYLVVMMGMIKTTLRLCDQEKARFSDFFSQYHLFFRYFFAIVLWGLITWVGMILLIIPGIIWGIKYFFCDYFVIDKKLGPIEALKQSSAITRGARWQLLGFFIVMGLINLLGALSFLVGLFITIPVTMLAIAFVYRKLLAQTEIVSTTQTLSEATG